MTVLNTWWRSYTGERWACVRCDVCLPTRIAVGTPRRLAAVGWRFDDFWAGQHRCIWCARRQARHSSRFARRQPNPALPTFLIIGAAKCGTTSLHQYLDAHPEVFMSECKELMFFHGPDCLNRLDGYSEYFDGSFPVRGEASPSYTAYPLLPGVPERIHSAIPDVKVIYLVRDPVERVIANYSEMIAQNMESQTPEEAFADVEDPYNFYAAQSRYATQLGRYRDVLRPDRIMVIDQADLLARRHATLRAAFRFLGVDETFVSSRFDELANTRANKRRITRPGWILRRSRLSEQIRKLPPDARETLLQPLRRLTTTRFRQQDVDESIRRRLEEALAGEAGKLKEITGLELGEV